MDLAPGEAGEFGQPLGFSPPLSSGSMNKECTQRRARTFDRLWMESQGRGARMKNEKERGVGPLRRNGSRAWRSGTVDGYGRIACDITVKSFLKPGRILADCSCDPLCGDPSRMDPSLDVPVAGPEPF